MNKEWTFEGYVAPDGQYSLFVLDSDDLEALIGQYDGQQQFLHAVKQFKDADVFTTHRVWQTPANTTGVTSSKAALREYYEGCKTGGRLFFRSYLKRKRNGKKDVVTQEFYGNIDVIAGRNIVHHHYKYDADVSDEADVTQMFYGNIGAVTDGDVVVNSYVVMGGNATDKNIDKRGRGETRQIKQVFKGGSKVKVGVQNLVGTYIKHVWHKFR